MKHFLFIAVLFAVLIFQPATAAPPEPDMKQETIVACDVATPAFEIVAIQNFAISAIHITSQDPVVDYCVSTTLTTHFAIGYKQQSVAPVMYTKLKHLDCSTSQEYISWFSVPEDVGWCSNIFFHRLN